MEEFKTLVLKKNNKRKKFFFVRFLIVIFILLMVLLYFVTPLSKVSSYSLNGNYFLSEEQVLDIMFLNRNSFLYRIEPNEKEELLNEYPLIKESKVHVSPFTMDVSIEELAPCLIDGEDVILSDGTVLDEKLYDNELMGDELKEIVKKIPKILVPLATFDQNYAIRNLLFHLSLSFVAKGKASVSYCSYTQDKNGPDGNFEFYFPISEELKDKFFEKEGKILFLLSASCVQYCQDHIEKGLDFLTLKLIEKIDNLLQFQDVSKAKIEKRNLLGNEEEVMIFYVKYEENQLTIKA